MVEDEGITPELHRRLAAALFNETWALLDKPDRAIEEDDRMVHAAHASRYHWGEVGPPVNLARGEWQIARVYSTLGRAEPTLHHAQRCLDLCTQHALGDFDLACAHQALARAHGVAGHSDQATQHLARAREIGEGIEDEEDRRILSTDLADLSGPSDL